MYKVILEIEQANYPIGSKPQTYSISCTGVDLYALKLRTKSGILKTVEYSGEYNVDMTVEWNGDFVEHEEWSVIVDKEKRTVTNTEDLELPKASVKFLFLMNSGETFVQRVTVTEKQFDEMVDCIDNSLLNPKAILRFSDSIIRVCDCSAVSWEILKGWEILKNE